MTKIVTPQEVITAYEDDVGITTYSFDYLCCVSAVLGIPARHIYLSGPGVPSMGGQPLLLSSIDKKEVESTWNIVKELLDTYRVVGSGIYSEYYLETIGQKYGSIHTTNGRVLLIHLDFGQNLDRIRGDVSVGERSIRQGGAVMTHDARIVSYWSRFRRVEIIGTLMYVEHICDSELRESAARLDAGLVPYRRYNTPIMQRGAFSSRGEVTYQRATFKLMGLILINSVHSLLSTNEIVLDGDVLVDERGTLRIPINRAEVEQAFASLWLKVSDIWSRVLSVDLAMENETDTVTNRIVTVDNVRYRVTLIV